MRSIFASFRPLSALPAIAASVPKASASDLRQAVERYARSIADIMRMQDRGLPVLPHQEAARDTTRDKLDAVRPKAARDLASAFERQPELIGQAASGKSAAAIRAMALEAEVRTNPVMRADRFVETWQGLSRQRDHAFQAGDHNRASTITISMGAMAKGLERDAQVDSILRGRKVELGLHDRGSGGISHQLKEYLGLGRGRGIDMSM